MTMVSLTALQLPLPSVVNVIVTEPELISAEVGVYVVVIIVSSAKVPVPLLVHLALVAVVKLPASVATESLAHKVSLVPASTEGAGVMKMFITSLTARQ